MGAFSVSLLFLGWTEHFGDGEDSCVDEEEL
jgi:hypothetical protein